MGLIAKAQSYGVGICLTFKLKRRVSHERTVIAPVPLLGAHVINTAAPDGAVCENCENEAKAKILRSPD